MREPTPYAERVLAVVASIPRGKVMTYGDVAEYMGEGGARAVGAVMRHFGGSVPWHRVVQSTGTPAPTHDDLACALLVDDDTPMTADGRRVDLRKARWNGR
ncbi:MAG TPA: MGMT family protein [Mycobacteriales bacterium]|nr:MGMT family protein [Mycobacteriales bacterium]